MNYTAQFQTLIQSNAADIAVATAIPDLASCGADLDAPINTQCQWSAAHVLAQKNKPLSMEAFADAGGDIEAADIYQWTPLDYALQYGDDVACANVIFAALAESEEYREDPEMLYLSLFEMLIRQRRDTAQNFIFLKLGRCIEMALAKEHYEIAKRMVEGVLESLRGRSAEFSSELVRAWRDQTKDGIIKAFFASELRARFEYDGARFVSPLRLHFDALGDAGALPPPQQRPLITVAPGIIDYPAA